jgi:uncharacterized membrane protein HdeD (DUF308 family)
MKQEAAKAPKYARTIDIVLGAIILILAGLVLASPAFAATLLVLWLSISLLFAGFEGIIVGASAKGLSGGQRAIRLIAGFVAVGLSIAVVAFPGAAILSSVVLLSIALVFLGASALGKGIMEKYMSGWARAMYIIVGGITIALSIPVIASPIFGLLTVYYVIASVLIINGAAYIIAGVTGAVYVPIGLGLASGRKSFGESDAA